MTEIKTPDGLTEAEEAQWHFDHRDELAERFLSSPASQNPQRGLAAQRFNLTPRLEMERADVELAFRQAAESGLTLHEYASQLFHEAVQARELRKAG